jgi:hypothetical protein
LCKKPLQRQGLRSKELTSLLGEGVVSRDYYSCITPGCNGHRFPKDEWLDIVNTSFSPGVRRLIARLGSHDSFEVGRQDLKIYSGIEVETKDVERVSEAIGAAILQQEAKERLTLLKQRPTPAIEYAVVKQACRPARLCTQTA